MNKKWLSILMMAVCVLAFAGSASAVTFEPTDCLYIRSDANGLATYTGCQADIERLKSNLQYCPDMFKADCGYNWLVKPVGDGLFQLDMQAVKAGQRALQAKDGMLWLRLPHERVVVGEGFITEMSLPNPDSEDGRGGAHLTFVADIGAEKYKALARKRWEELRREGDTRTYDEIYLVTRGGEACRQATPAEESVSAAKAELAQLQKHEAVSCRVVLKGDLARTDVLRDIVRAYWHVDVEVQLSHGHEVVVVGEGGTRRVPISNKLLGQLKKLVGNPNAGDSLTSLCPEQARLIREAIGNCK